MPPFCMAKALLIMDLLGQQPEIDEREQTDNGHKHNACRGRITDIGRSEAVYVIHKRRRCIIRSSACHHLNGIEYFEGTDRHDDQDKNSCGEIIGNVIL